jgi:hypothetical protein
MRQNLKISVVKDHANGGAVTCRSITMREKILRFFLGAPQRLTVIVPGESVDEIAISEVPKGGEDYAT